MEARRVLLQKGPMAICHHRRRIRYLEAGYFRAAIYTLGSTGIPINITKICEQLTSCIVESYDSAAEYQKLNWEHIAMAINDKRPGLSHYAPQAPGNVGSGSSELSSLTATSSDSSSSSTKKQLKFFPDDKEKTKHMFNNLNESKMWRLSTGTIVEKKMKEFALNCTHEHPVHSVILDLSDINWEKYLTDKEINEIESLADATQLIQELECPASDWIRNYYFIHKKYIQINKSHCTLCKGPKPHRTPNSFVQVKYSNHIF